MRPYENLVRKILDEGELRGNRTGKQTLTTFGHWLEFDLSEGAPIVTGKETKIKSCAAELVSFLQGCDNHYDFKKNGTSIWAEWATKEDYKVCRPLTPEERRELLAQKHNCSVEAVENWQLTEALVLENEDIPKEVIEYNVPEGSIGPMYGVQWRKSVGLNGKGEEIIVDQLWQAILLLKHNPTSRRIIVNSWIPHLLPDESISPEENVKNGQMALAPCHFAYQLYLAHPDNPEKRTLHLMWHQRSCDVPLGLPFNILSYTFLTHLIAKEIGAKPGRLMVSLGDTHIYVNQVEGMKQYLEQEQYELPQLELPEDCELWSCTTEQLVASVKNYVHGPYIKMPIAK